MTANTAHGLIQAKVVWILAFPIAYFKPHTIDRHLIKMHILHYSCMLSYICISFLHWSLYVYRYMPTHIHRLTLCISFRIEMGKCAAWGERLEKAMSTTNELWNATFISYVSYIICTGTAMCKPTGLLWPISQVTVFLRPTKNSLVNGNELPDKCYFSESSWKKAIQSYCFCT